MRQLWITAPGAPEVLSVKEGPDPEPGAGALRIRVEASGVSFADILRRMGLYPDLPAIPVVAGYEVGGRVDAAGAGADPDWIGRDVFALTHFGVTPTWCAFPPNGSSRAPKACRPRRARRSPSTISRPGS